MSNILNLKGVKFFAIVLLAVAVLATFGMVAVQGQAAGKKSGPITCEAPGKSNWATPHPVRPIFLGPIGTKIFQLPNGSAVNLSADLQTMLNTVVVNESNFAPSDYSEDDSSGLNSCHSHIELRSTVTHFQMDVAEVGVTFGYTPGGAVVPGGTNVEGKVNVKVGAIAMDFSVWNCNEGRCSAVAASTSTHHSAGVNLAFEMDFGAIHTAPSFVYNTPLAEILRKIMVDGLKQLAVSSRVNELPWQAHVREVYSETGMLIFDAGANQRIHANEAFEIYAPTDASSTGLCDVYQSVATVHSVSSGAVSSTAIVDQASDPRGIKVGDAVLIHTVESR